MRRTPMTASVAAGALALTLAACSSGGADDGDAATGTAATTATENATDTADVAYAADLVELSEQMAAAQTEQGTVHVEMSYAGDEIEGLDPSTLGTQSADLRFGDTPEDLAMTMSMELMGQQMEMLLVDGSLYMNAGAITGDTSSWIGGPLDEMVDDPTLGGTADLSKQFDAVAQAEALGDAVTSFEHTGSEVVDGQDVEVYTLTVDAARAADGVVPGGADSLGATVEEIGMVYRVTPEGLPVSSETTVDLDGNELVATQTYSRWGEPVDVEAPPADQVMGWDEVMGG